MAIALYGEGCLDIALGRFLLTAIGVSDDNIQDEIGRGWRATIERAISPLRRFTEEADESSYSMPSRSIVFVDADADAYTRIVEIKEIIENSIHDALIAEIKPQPSTYDAPLGLHVRLKGYDNSITILLWAVRQGERVGGTVEDVLLAMLKEGYDCKLNISYEDLKKIIDCPSCPEKEHRFYATMRKLIVIAAVASCAGAGGTLATPIGSSAKYCGIPITRVLARMGKLRDTTVFNLYTSIIRKYLGLDPA